MPISAVIHLLPQEDVWLPPTMGNLIHGAFLDIFDRVEPAIAERLHAGTGCQPFTISPLQGKFERPESDRILVREGTECWLRFTLLEDVLFEPLSRFFLEGKVPAIRLGKGLFQLMRLATSGSGEDAQWSGYASYEELRERSRADVWIDLRFYSPTAFREQSPRGSQSKRRNCTFPEPIRCFQSWVNRWNAFSPLPIDRERLLAFVNTHARVDHIDSRSKMLDYGRYRQLGFVGD
ncbi:MAG: CRISPR system precrRNA processing endoribonuclease RAMP protein Cas6, partial [Chloroflexi bacterium]|nr:CRISPR system precrRNA processing endoribonuclease RAMP protein Cas6 [Chloroflexota bacterium]